MKKFLVILLVLMTCFVANVNAQEWRWTGDFFSGGEYKLTKQNLSYKIIFLSSNMYVNCIKNTTIKSIDIEGDYLKIHIKNGKNIVDRITMKGILEKLPNTKFKRVHRSFIVPLEKIKSVRKKVIQLEQIEVPIGNSYEEDFINSIKQFNLPQ
jgi:DNA-binding LytR/AlgR family response regulator